MHPWEFLALVIVSDIASACVGLYAGWNVWHDHSRCIGDDRKDD